MEESLIRKVIMNSDADSEIGEKETERAAEDDHSGAPIDRGWAWIVLAACVFQISIYGGMMRSFGIFFLQYQMRFDSNAAETAMMSMIQNIIVSTTGAGMALIHPPVLAILGVYFKNHRGLANSIFIGGSSVGGLIFAPIVVKLFDEYQYTGAMLIISRLLMNICVAALLLRPIESYSKKKMKSINEDTEITAKDNLLLKGNSDKDDTDSTNLKFDEIKLESDIFRSENKDTNLLKHPLEEVNNFTDMQSHKPDLVNHIPQKSHLLQRVRSHSFDIRHRKISEDSNRYDSESNIYHSSNVLEGVIKAISRSQGALHTSMCCGQYMSVYAVLLMEVIGPEKFKSCLGFGTLVHGTSIAVFFPIAGILRDVTGSYKASFHLLGGLAYFAGVLAFFVPIVKRWENGKEAEDPFNRT